MSFPPVGQVFRSTRLYYRLLARHHSRLPGQYTSPPVLSEDLSSEKTKRSHHRRSTWRWHGIPNVCTLCFPEAPPNPFFQSLDTWHHQRSSSAVVCASENIRKTLKPLALPLFRHLSAPSKRSKFFSANPRSFSTLLISNSLQRSSDHQKVPLLLLLLIFVAF